MLSIYGRKPAAVIVEPIAKKLGSWGITPNMVTITGTLLAVLTSITLIPQGYHLCAALLFTIIVCTDMIDGTMARMNGGGTAYGATLDATCDRIADGAIFIGIVWWLMYPTGNLGYDPESASRLSTQILMAATLISLVSSQVISYVKARAEASQIKVQGGLIERPERLIITLLALALNGFGVPYALLIAMTLLALASIWTVIQRLHIAKISENAQLKMDAPLGAREFGSSSSTQSETRKKAPGEHNA